VLEEVNVDGIRSICTTGKGVRVFLNTHNYTVERISY